MTDPVKVMKPARRRRWLRRLSVGLGGLGLLLVGGYWYLGRESTLQALVQQLSNISGGNVSVTGASGSLTGKMHFAKLVQRGEHRRTVATDIDIDWSPLQLITNGLAIHRLHVASMSSEAIGVAPPAAMPDALEPPVRVSIAAAQVDSLVLIDGASRTELRDLRLTLSGDARQWQLRKASASTPWGALSAEGSIGAVAPFKLDAHATLTHKAPVAGQKDATLALQVGGDLKTVVASAQGASGNARVTASLAAQPFSATVLQTLRIDGQGINPAQLDPQWPVADLNLALSVMLAQDKMVSGSLALTNTGAAGRLDQHLLPLHAITAKLGGGLDSPALSAIDIDLGQAGKFSGEGKIKEGRASLTLGTKAIDLHAIHTSMKPTAIAGEISINGDAKTQTVAANLAQQGLRLELEAVHGGAKVALRQARLHTQGGSVHLAGEFDLDAARSFQVSGGAVHFDPAAFGDYPSADLNADFKANGSASANWQVDASFTVLPSRLFKQVLSGAGKLKADARHVSALDAQLALGQNTAQVRGSFGGAGEHLTWRVQAQQLAAVYPALSGALLASGVVSGTMQAPRTSFDIDAKALALAPAQGGTSVLHASGEAWLAADATHAPAFTLTGSGQGINPAAFGAAMSGNIKTSFEASARLGAAWSASVKATLDDSTLAGAPFSGHLAASGSPGQLNGADLALRLGANNISARGGFGGPGDKLDWRIDAPQLNLIGADFGGGVQGQGSLSGTLQAPALSATIDGNNLQLRAHHLKKAHLAINVGSGHGAADPVVSDLALDGYSGPAGDIATARVQTSGTRAAHQLRATLRGANIDANADIKGSADGNAWSGTIDALQNRGAYGFTLQAPLALRIAGPAADGALGLLHPEQLSLRDAVVALPAGSITVRALDKEGSRWHTEGTATGVPLLYLAQVSSAARENASGNLTLGADWALDLRTAGATGRAPELSGTLHAFRQSGDMVAGADVPVALGLRQLDARAEVVNGALHMRFEMDGARAGRTSVEANAQLLDGHISNDSPLTVKASADMGSIAWLAPLAGQPGLELDGTLNASLTATGTVGAPKLAGSVRGDKLSVLWAEQGIKLRNGQMQAQLDDDQFKLQRLRFDGPTGSAAGEGMVRFAGGEASMQFKLSADKLELMSRPDRTLVISGDAALTRDQKHFQLTGKMRAERALFELAPQDRPTMSDDVFIVRRDGAAPGKSAPVMPLTIDLDAELGNAFALRGMGLDAQLAGTLHVRSSEKRVPRATGSISVVSGTYSAYGQKLAIERGQLTFSGPYDNPSLNILALRKRPEGESLSETNVEAGVEVRGTAQAPVARLVSTPSVPDSEKLAWLVLGHGTAGTSGSEADVLGAAAGALLGGSGGLQSRMASSLGIDELGLSQAKGLEATVVTVGKRVSQKAYISFEQGTTSATSLVKLRYKLNPRVTLQFQTGANTAFDVLYTWAFD